MSNILYKLRDPHPALDFSAPILIGPSATGSISITSSVASDLLVYPNVKINCSGLNTQEDSVYIFSLFPSGTIPRRIGFETVFWTESFSTNNLDLYFILGTQNSSSLSFNGMCFSLKGNKFATISDGVFSSSVNNFAQPWFLDGKYLNYTFREFEIRNQTPTNTSDIAFRCHELTTTSREDATYQYNTLYQSHINFPYQKFPTSWNNKTFNKLFLGVSCVSLDSGNIYLDTVRIQKHFMDWDI